MLKRKQGFYEKRIKRFLDIICSLLAIIVFSWLYAIIAIIVRIKMGSPVLFKRPRSEIIDPKTGKEKIFDMYKLRSMTDARDKDGNLLRDEQRLPAFGRMLRETSLDELPQAFNIIKGERDIIRTTKKNLDFMRFWRLKVSPVLKFYVRTPGRTESQRRLL